MGARELRASEGWREVGRGRRSGGTGKSERDDLRNRHGGRSAPKRTILDMRVTAAMLLAGGVGVQVLQRRLRVRTVRADLQQEWRSARRHEPERHIGPKQQDRKHQDGSRGTSTMTTWMVTNEAHTASSRCQSARVTATLGIIHRAGDRRPGGNSHPRPSPRNLLAPRCSLRRRTGTAVRGFVL